MALIFIVAFIGVFAIVAPLLVWLSGAQNAAKKEKVVAVLDSAIGNAPIVKSEDNNFRRSETVSTIPLLNRLLQQLDLMPRLTMLLRQANIKWTPGALILMCLAGFALPAYVAELRTGSILIALGVGAAA